MGISKVTRNYQITVPKDIRALKNIKVGDEVLFIVDGGRVELVKMKKEILEKACDLWSKKTKESSVKYINKMRKEWNTRAKRLDI